MHSTDGVFEELLARRTAVATVRHHASLRDALGDGAPCLDVKGMWDRAAAGLTH